MTVFLELLRINERRPVYSKLTTATLWTDPHISGQMLRFHLDGSTDASSRRTEFIEASAGWIGSTFELGSGVRVLDLGCGPGLYTARFARTGASVTGVDFSARSIAYARDAAQREGLDVTYVNADYLSWESDERFDLVTMIYLDYCVLSPAQRRTLLRKAQRLLARDGAFLFDVSSTNRLATLSETASYAYAPTGGFWSPNPHFLFENKLVYAAERVSLDKYVIVERDRTWEIYDWLQHYTPETLAAELADEGLDLATVLGDVAGAPFDPGAPEFAVVARSR